MNVYSKLLNINSPILSSDDILCISLFNHIAEIYNGENKIDDEYADTINKIEDSDINDIDNIVSKIIKYYGMNKITDEISLSLFIDMKNKILDELIILDNELYDQKVNSEEILSIPNKEVQNKEYYDSFLGYKFIDDCGDKFLHEVFNSFISAKKERVKELHRVTKSYLCFKKYPDCDANTRMDYYSIMGLGYMYHCEPLLNNIEETKEENKKLVMIPLSNINMDYAKNKIHILEIELCYINRNIKAIKKELIERKKKK